MELLEDYCRSTPPPLAARVLRHLIDRPWEHSCDDLARAMYEHREDGGPDDAGNVIRITICRLRTKYLKRNIKIHKCGHNYSVSLLSPIILTHSQLRRSGHQGSHRYRAWNFTESRRKQCSPR